MPYHPQTSGKPERYNQSINQEVNQVPSEAPGELEEAISDFVNYSNQRRYHKALSNVTPNDVLKGGILSRRREVKAQTLASRQRYNRQHRESSNTAISPWSLLNENVPLSLVSDSRQKGDGRT